MTAIEEIEAQGALEPGQEGWWRVWGASILDVKAGDVVVDRTGAYEVFEVKGRTLTQVVMETSEGEIRAGMMAQIKLIRKSTHNILSDTVGDQGAHVAAYMALPEVGKGEPEAEVAPEPEPAPIAPAEVTDVAQEIANTIGEPYAYAVPQGKLARDKALVALTTLLLPHFSSEYTAGIEAESDLRAAEDNEGVYQDDLVYVCWTREGYIVHLAPEVAPEPELPVYTHVACPSPSYLASLRAEYAPQRVEIAPYFTMMEIVAGAIDTAEYVRGCAPRKSYSTDTNQAGELVHVVSADTLREGDVFDPSGDVITRVALGKEGYVLVYLAGREEPTATKATNRYRVLAETKAGPQPIPNTADVYTPDDAQKVLAAFLGYATPDAPFAMQHALDLMRTARRSGWSSEVNGDNTSRVTVSNAGLGYYRLTYARLV